MLLLLLLSEEVDTIANTMAAASTTPARPVCRAEATRCASGPPLRKRPSAAPANCRLVRGD